MPNPENLKPFKKGDDPRRNTTGKNKGAFSITNLIKEELQKYPEGEDKKTYADLIIKRIMSKAIKDGDTRMIEKIWAYMDGMPAQAMDITSGGEKIIPIYGNKSIQGHESNTENLPAPEEN